MKSETQIAKEKIEDLNKRIERFLVNENGMRSQGTPLLTRENNSERIKEVFKIEFKFLRQHKASCQRELKFWGNFKFNVGVTVKKIKTLYLWKDSSDRLTDLKNAIKSYDNAGI